VARFLAEEMGKKVLILDRRAHIGGNMYDYRDEKGILVQQYGPHTFHTRKKELYDYMCRFADWQEYKLTCGAVINDKYTPTPFNFQTVDDFFPAEKAAAIKDAINAAYPGQEFAPVLELLEHPEPLIREYARFLFDNDYSLYTAKQWGVSPDTIDPSVLRRVPVRFNYDIGYFDDKYQVMPVDSFTAFFEKLLEHPAIAYRLSVDARDEITLDGEKQEVHLKKQEKPIVCIYTGAIDELFLFRYGALPYRSLRFEWKHEQKESFQEAPVVAYPQAPGFTRITEYTKLPVQKADGWTAYAVEYSLPYQAGVKSEPYYPVLTEESGRQYEKYRREAENYRNLYLCGRLADFKYYNMDQALERALQLCTMLREQLA
jgi:UDP-galactopyranose mutase